MPRITPSFTLSYRGTVPGAQLYWVEWPKAAGVMISFTVVVQPVERRVLSVPRYLVLCGFHGHCDCEHAMAVQERLCR